MYFYFCIVDVSATFTDGVLEIHGTLNGSPDLFLISEVFSRSYCTQYDTQGRRRGLNVVSSCSYEVTSYLLQTLMQ